MFLEFLILSCIRSKIIHEELVNTGEEVDLFEIISSTTKNNVKNYLLVLTTLIMINKNHSQTQSNFYGSLDQMEFITKKMNKKII